MCHAIDIAGSSPPETDSDHPFGELVIASEPHTAEKKRNAGKE